MNNWESLLEKTPSNSILVSTPNQKLLRFYCPILATCCKPIAGYKSGDSVTIEGIYTNESNQMLYLIDGLKLPFDHFHINTKI